MGGKEGGKKGGRERERGIKVDEILNSTYTTENTIL